jgi:hypothetical protein
MNAWVLALAILLGSGIVAGAILLKPSPFRECVALISADIFREDLTVTLDPRDVEAEAARICSGAAV